MFDPSIVGHKDIREHLLKEILAERLGKSIIFSGPNCIGKRRVALELAKRETCVSYNACGQCSSCAMFTEPIPTELPNLLRIAPDGKAGLIRIGAIRGDDLVNGGVIQWAHRASLSNYHRWIIIEDAHRLNSTSANIILKILEEPPIGTHFILVTHYPEAVISTIRSRCERINFKYLSNDETWTVAKKAGWKDEKRELWTTLSSGTFSYLDKDSFQRIFNQINAWISLLKKIPFSNLYDHMLPKKDIGISQNEQLHKSLELLLLILSDINRCRNNRPIRLKSWLADIQQLSTSELSIKEPQVKLFKSLRNTIRNPNPESIIREIATSLQ